MSNVDLEYGRLISQSHELDIPLTVAEFWSGFDDYLTLQKALGGHEDTKLLTGGGRPNNGVNAEVAFSFAGGETREVLWQKDDTNHVWVMGLPQSNVLFSYYRATVAVWQAEKTAKAKLTIDGVLVSKDEKERQLTLDTLAKFLPTRINEINDLVLQRDGLRMSLKLKLNYSIEDFWKIVSNWNDISWVMGATSMEDLGDDIRRVHFGDIALEEKLDSVTEETHTLVYSILKSAMPVSMYKGTLRLKSRGNDKLVLHYDSVFLPREGQDREAVKKGLEQGFAQRLEWMKNKFN
ncbi:SRPBCC family protein [Shewanella violacea]|uniref:SRPBCC family protein n=1 Tax=Shewanella violacea (strain JCM 10179 / CIP 106290 / LMG 19151 / DSS12) TaxID=637905 RepID=D4ZL62_SHEVD|nr:SRPBCC family protein [Shewanella violacea]BAJ02411.1 hypothetical protein SVI_2440 [Shewanella violacea DSS12]